jgi:Ni/Fe-hydrogenase 1 B-type cytochrome subunit
MEKLFKRVYVWEFPVRFTHWVNVLCIVMLSITGYYISNPFIHGYETSHYVMGWVRFIHYVAAYLFVVSLAIRLYWAFAGNKYASWKALFPFKPEQTMRLIQQILFYSFAGKKPPLGVGHTPLAGFTYLLIIILYLIEITTGFALYSLYNPSGLYGSLFGWLLLIFSSPTLRLIHHIVMWLLIYFILIHIYVTMYLDQVEKSGLMGSIFTGNKFVYPEVKIKD